MSYLRNIIPAIGVAASGIIAVSAADAPPPVSRPAVSITTAEAQRIPLPLQIEAIGSVQPISSVQLRSRVDAQIDLIAVADGAMVKKGDLLVKLDSRQIEAQLKQAVALLERNKAQLEMNERDVRRFSELVAKKSTPQINLDNAKTTTLSTKAAIAGEEAAIEILKIQSSYYTLYAPISGKVGAFSLKVGSLARGGDSSAASILATLNQVSPIYVTMAIPQRYLPDLKAALSNNIAAVIARPQGGKQWIDGKIAFLDNAIDAATGMLTVRASFPNTDEALWPGQLCDVRITLRIDKDVVTIPREALQMGQKGSYVFVVNSEGNAVALRSVTVDREQNGRTAILDGLKPGETIVIDGANLLTNGAAVAIRKLAVKPDAS